MNAQREDRKATLLYNDDLWDSIRALIYLHPDAEGGRAGDEYVSGTDDFGIHITISRDEGKHRYLVRMTLNPSLDAYLVGRGEAFVLMVTATYATMRLAVKARE